MIENSMEEHPARNWLSYWNSQQHRIA
jgi:hypothetical protein